MFDYDTDCASGFMKTHSKRLVGYKPRPRARKRYEWEILFREDRYLFYLSVVRIPLASGLGLVSNASTKQPHQSCSKNRNSKAEGKRSKQNNKKAMKKIHPTLFVGQQRPAKGRNKGTAHGSGAQHTTPMSHGHIYFEKMRQ